MIKAVRAGGILRYSSASKVVTNDERTEDSTPLGGELHEDVLTEDPFMPKNLGTLLDRYDAMSEGERIIREQGINGKSEHFGKFALVNIRSSEITICATEAEATSLRRSFGHNLSYLKPITGY
jgi:hypothetical protein